MNPAVVVLGILGIVALLAFASEYLINPRPQKPPELVEVRSDDPALEVSVMEIASKFICSCGACGGQPLDECTCNRAIEERQFIRNYLQGGQTADQVTIALNNTFGWMKPEFDTLLATSGDVNAKPGRITVSNDILEGPFLTAARPTLASKLATAADRVEIFSHFQCPCGQCGIDELKECECSHPRGAKEVKAFIDKKITEGKYTIADLISEVEKTYGGRKF
jgi:cytochrome c-type biogenesis protein CcmH/NrfF